MRELLTVRRQERWLLLATMLVMGFFQVLMVSKFFALFADYDIQQWTVFNRNFHMSGFDPITYAVLTDWHQGYDLLRHPLLGLMMYPLYLLNQGLWALTGANCCQLIMGVLLWVCGTYAWLMLYRVVHELVGLGRALSILFSALGFGFAYILIATIVPDHFGLSLALLLSLLYRSGSKVARHETFSVREAWLWYLVIAGVTLSNGVLAFIMIGVVNGKSLLRRQFLFPCFVWPTVGLVGLVAIFGMAFGKGRQHVAAPISQQLVWVKENVPRTDVAIENFFGESLQLHRKHILGDVLTGRPTIVRYSWPAQYVVEGMLLVLVLAGAWMGRRERLVWMAVGVVGFNVALHLLLSFAIDEVYIMAAHWAFCLPVLMAYAVKGGGNTARWSVIGVVSVITLYLWVYHTVLLYRYLTWPLVEG